MDIGEKFNLENARTRRMLELFLIAFGIRYLALLLTMNSMCPLGSQSFWVFFTFIALSISAVHFVRPLNWLLVTAAVALPAWPFCGHLFLFMDSMACRTVDYPLIHKLMCYLHGYSIWAAALFMLLFIVGSVGGTGAWIRECRQVRAVRIGGREQ